jgi:hypothetical protein
MMMLITARAMTTALQSTCSLCMVLLPPVLCGLPKLRDSLGVPQAETRSLAATAAMATYARQTGRGHALGDPPHAAATRAHTRAAVLLTPPVPARLSRPHRGAGASLLARAPAHPWPSSASRQRTRCRAERTGPPDPYRVRTPGRMTQPWMLDVWAEGSMDAGDAVRLVETHDAG